MSESAVGANSAAEGEVVAAENQSSDVANGTANNAQATREPTRLENFLGIAKSLIIRGVIIYFISSFLAPKAPAPTSPTGAPIATTKATNLFHDGTVMALHVYLSENETLSDYDPQNLFWYKDGLVFGDWTSGPFKDGSYVMEKSVPITESMKNNGSLFLHAFITRQGESPNPEASNYGKKFIGATWKQLNRFKQLKASTTKNLLTGETEKDDVEDGKIVSHWHTNFTLNLITDQTVWTSGAVPMPMDQFIQFTDDGKNYKPVLYPNDFWNMARDYKPLNESLKLRVTLQPLSLLKWQIYAAQGMRQMWNVWGENDQSQTDQEQDTLKETLLDTNPYLLGITIAVSILHSVFELLAFKNDIQFWNKRDSLEGLSVRSVFFGVFQSLVVLLYVLDNETNTLVRVSCFIGLGIELWKIYKVVDIKFENGWIQFKDKGSYVQSSTRVYDELAFKYLSWLCFPLLAGYCVYALLYLEHKGWYSFVLDLLYGFLLTFGFIMMTPQLFINYKLHSVAHLPWRMLTYKFLNTFIDDMFAFVIKMPTMYRLGCFRDDIVFLIFLYQRWIYPVDKSRRNEFGYKPEDENKSIEDSKANNQQVEAAAPSKESKKDK